MDLLALLPPGTSAFDALVLVLTGFISAAIAAGLGLGGGVLMLAVMASVLPATAVVPVHAVVQIGANAGRAALFRRHVEWPMITGFGIGTAIGAALGARLYVALPTDTLRLILGLFVLYSVWVPHLNPGRLPERWFPLAGVLSAFCTMFVGATGPLVAAFLPRHRLDRHQTVAAQAACMTVQHSLKMVAFGFIGFAFLPWLPLALLIIVVGFVGTVAGKRILDRLPEARFRMAFNVLLTLLALRLIHSAL